MPVLQPKRKSGHNASIAFRRCRPHYALVAHVVGQVADPVRLDGENDSSQYYALLRILEKIENNAEVVAKTPSMIKPKGAEGRRKMESIDSRIPKKSKQVGFSDKQCALCKTTLMTVVSTLPTLLLSKGMGAQEMHEGADILIKPFKSERTRRGKFRSDNSQRS